MSDNYGIPGVEGRSRDKDGFPSYNRNIKINAPAEGVAEGTTEATDHIRDYNEENQSVGSES